MAAPSSRMNVAAATAPAAPGGAAAAAPAAPKAPHCNCQRDVEEDECGARGGSGSGSATGAAEAAAEEDGAFAVGTKVWFRSPVNSEWRLGTVHELYFGMVGRALVDDGASTPRWIPIDQRFMAAAAVAGGAKSED